jgi:hypothetical protein
VKIIGWTITENINRKIIVRKYLTYIKCKAIKRYSDQFDHINQKKVSGHDHINP